MTWKMILAMALIIIPFLIFMYQLKRYCDRIIETMMSWILKGKRNSEDGGEDDIL